MSPEQEVNLVSALIQQRPEDKILYIYRALLYALLDKVEESRRDVDIANNLRSDSYCQEDRDVMAMHYALTLFLNAKNPGGLEAFNKTFNLKSQN